MSNLTPKLVKLFTEHINLTTMKNEEITRMYATTVELFWDDNEEDFDENWLVFGSDLFNTFDESEIELGV
jgi:hypothetical protein